MMEQVATAQPTKPAKKPRKSRKKTENKRPLTDAEVRKVSRRLTKILVTEIDYNNFDL